MTYEEEVQSCERCGLSNTTLSSCWWCAADQENAEVAPIPEIPSATETIDQLLERLRLMRKRSAYVNVEEEKQYMPLVTHNSVKKASRMPICNADASEEDNTEDTSLDPRSPLYFSELAKATAKAKEEEPVGAWECNVCSYKNCPPARQTYYTDATTCGVMHPFEVGDEVVWRFENDEIPSSSVGVILGEVQESGDSPGIGGSGLKLEVSFPAGVGDFPPTDLWMNYKCAICMEPKH
jgi:hypothetical protein